MRGYLIETETLRPICTVYESSMYTQEMQEFLAKTTDDFDEEKVLNLDDDDTNNFAVYGDDTLSFRLIQKKILWCRQMIPQIHM
ncbi:MAG: hypothetical protein ACLU9V_04380 [Roseburia sp.]